MIRRALLYTSVLAFVGYGVLLIRNASFSVGGSDSSGYANAAKMIAAGRLVLPLPILDRLDLPDRFRDAFIPLGLIAGPRPRTMVPLYPSGYPLHLAAAGILFGWNHAPYLVSPLAGLLLVLLAYLLARELSLSRPLAFICAAILGGSSILLTYSEQAMSDVVAALWVGAAILFALRSRRKRAWAAAAGAAFGMAVLVRPTNAIALVPLLLAIGWRPGTLALFVAGGLPCAVFQFRWNSVLYGEPFRTGYWSVRQFRLSNFPNRFVHYTRTLVQIFSALVPIGWLCVAGDRRMPVRDRALLLIWFAGYFLLYCFWGPYETWWYTRYLLPGIPAFIVGAVLVARDLLRILPPIADGSLRSPRLAIVVAAVLLLIVADTERRRISQWKPLDVAEGEKTFPLAMDLARAVLPEHALVVSMHMSGALRYYTDFQPVRWDCLSPADFSIVRAKAEARGYRFYALLAPFEEERAMALVSPEFVKTGSWKRIGQVRDVKLWELD